MINVKRIGVGIVGGSAAIAGLFYVMANMDHDLHVFNGTEQAQQVVVGEEVFTLEPGSAHKLDLPQAEQATVTVDGQDISFGAAGGDLGANTFVVDTDTTAAYLLVDLSSMYGEEEVSAEQAAEAIELEEFSAAGKTVHRFNRSIVDSGPGTVLPDEVTTFGDSGPIVHKIFRVRAAAVPDQAAASQYVDAMRNVVMLGIPLTKLEYLALGDDEDEAEAELGDEEEGDGDAEEAEPAAAL